MAEHIAESELAIYAFDPAAVSDERRRTIESHTAECAECRANFDFFAVEEEDLGDADVWERGMGSATRESLMAHAARVTEEDNEAKELLKPLFDAPARVAWANLHRQKRFLSGGVVRQLNARALALRESEPLDALTFADAAIAVAEALPDDTYRAKAIYELRQGVGAPRSGTAGYGRFPGGVRLACARRACIQATRIIRIWSCSGRTDSRERVLLSRAVCGS